MQEVFDEAIKTDEGKARMAKAIEELLTDSEEFREGIADYLVQSWEIMRR